MVAVAAVAAWLIAASVSTTHSTSSGPGVIRQSLDPSVLSQPVQVSVPSSGSASLTSCAGSAHSVDPVRGLLEIPRLGVDAPVEQGNGDAQLGVAVGHDAYSVWPGATGNSVLAAHDAGYFARLPELSDGDTILYVAPCTTYAFSVSSHRIASAGSAVDDTRAPAITLVTGWPTDALRSTSERYLVTAVEMSQSFTVGVSQYLATTPGPTAPVPSTLAGEGVTLATYRLPTGTFRLTGSPNETWAQSTSPLTVERPAVEDFIAGVRSLTQKRLGWWSDVAPGVAPPAPLIGARNPSYTSALDLTALATGDRVDGVTLTNEVTVSGGKAPGRYSITVDETIEGQTLVITHWGMHRL